MITLKNLIPYLNNGYNLNRVDIGNKTFSRFDYNIDIEERVDIIRNAGKYEIVNIYNDFAYKHFLVIEIKEIDTENNDVKLLTLEDIKDIIGGSILIIKESNGCYAQRNDSGNKEILDNKKNYNLIGIEQNLEIEKLEITIEARKVTIND